MNADYYLDKNAFCGRQINKPVSPELNMIVVIPCYREPDLIETLISLSKCYAPKYFTEVIVVINHSKSETEETKEYNRNTFELARDWIECNPSNYIKFYLIKAFDMPPKTAGVGLARKIGMDEAVRRFNETSQQDGVIICLDADCLVDINYLTEIENHFALNTLSPACHIAFEHRIDDSDLSEYNKNAIAIYEVYLRWYKLNFEKTKHPYAHYTIGSCMAVRSSAYQKQGGMNKRKAGEDFYFLQKIFPLENFTELSSTCVYPSARGSDRVPFGTGAFINNHNDTEILNYESFNPTLFDELKNFIQLLKIIYHEKKLMETESYPTLLKYLESIGIYEKLEEARQHSSNYTTFKKRFFQFFNGLVVMQFMHFGQSEGVADIKLMESAYQYLEQIDLKNFKREKNLLNLLITYRKLERLNIV